MAFLGVDEVEVGAGAAAARDFASEAAVGAKRPEEAAGVRVGELPELCGMDGVFERPVFGVFDRAGGFCPDGVLERG